MRVVQSRVWVLCYASCQSEPLLIGLIVGKSKVFLFVFLHTGHSDQCFCLPATTSKTCEYIFCFLHLLVLHFCWHTCKYHACFRVCDRGGDLNRICFTCCHLEKLSCLLKRSWQWENGHQFCIYCRVSTWTEPTCADQL